jgi:hypothetical protein
MAHRFRQKNLKREGRGQERSPLVHGTAHLGPQGNKDIDVPGKEGIQAVYGKGKEITGKLMPISKKIRFEVFKRDGFKCAYCGKSPPQVILEADHIDPRAKGGDDDLNNLITACFDCNRGKKDIPLSKIPPVLSDNLLVLREQEEQLQEYRRFVKKIERRLQKDIQEINAVYTEAYPGWIFSDHFNHASLKTFLRLLPKDRIIEALEIAISKYPSNKDRVINYFCGICWHRIRGTEKPENR